MSEFWVGPRNEPDYIRLGPAVASGAEGVVYRGFVDLASGPVEVAVKMLQPGHLAQLGEWTERWREQVELLKQVEVPGLVAVRNGFVGALPHPSDHADDTTASLYLVMDWVEGVSLDRWARSVEVAEPEQLLMALVPVAAALDLLHSGAATAGRPVVHRDVKPANILIRPGGDTVLVDVGSVRGLIDEPGRSGVVGTPGYIAPEVRADGRYSPSADRYSLGAVAFALLTGTEPPPEGGIEELARLLSAAPLLQGRGELVDHVLAMLDPDPEQRPSCLANWVAQLRRSSLVALPGEVALPPRAPGRNPERPSKDRQRFSRQKLGSPLQKIAVLVAALGLLAIIAILLADSGDDPGQEAATESPEILEQPLEDGSVDETTVGATGQWQLIDPGPLATRGEPNSVWTGTEVLVVGGLIIDQYQALSDGAAFDPSTGEWRPIPPRPVSGRVMHAVWTGEELITFGTEGISLEPITTGAAFNPATGQWRNVSLPPSSEVMQDVVWTGQRVLAWQAGGSASPGALYDPMTDRWTPIPANSVPGAVSAGRAIWTGEELAVQGALAPASGGPVEPRLFLFDPDQESWRVSSALPGELAMWPYLSPVWSGQEVLLTSNKAGSDALATYAYDPRLDQWRTVASPEISEGSTYSRGVRLDDGRVIVRVTNPEGPLQIFDPKSGQWSSSGPAPGAMPTPDGALVSTGGSVFHWGIATDGDTVQTRSPNAAWLWSP